MLGVLDYSPRRMIPEEDAILRLLQPLASLCYCFQMLPQGPLTYRVPIRYHAVIFVNAAELTATPKVLSTANLLFQDLGWPAFPVLESTIVAPILTMKSIPFSQRVQWLSPDRRWQITLSGDRFEVLYQASIVPLGESLSLDSFCEEASRLLRTVLGAFPFISHRLACVQSGWVAAESIDGFAGLQNRIFRRAASSAATPYTEWHWRTTTQVEREFADCCEKTNTIFALNYPETPSLINGEPVPGLQLDLDINTLPANTTPRFDTKHIEEFFKQAPSWNTALQTDLATLFKGE